MKITEVRIFPTESKDGKLKAFATMTFDDWFVVRNVKIIQGNNGLFVAMPSRKAMDSCCKCGFKNVRGSKYCNLCGSGIKPKPVPEEASGERQGDHMDIAHPVTQECRVYIQEEVLSAYEKEREKQDRQGDTYKPASDDFNVRPAENVPSHEVSESQRVRVPEREEPEDIEL